MGTIALKHLREQQERKPKMVGIVSPPYGPSRISDYGEVREGNTPIRDIEEADEGLAGIGKVGYNSDNPANIGNLPDKPEPKPRRRDPPDLPPEKG